MSRPLARRQTRQRRMPWATLAGITALWVFVVGCGVGLYTLGRYLDGYVGEVPIAGTGIAGTDWGARTTITRDYGSARSYAMR